MEDNDSDRAYKALELEPNERHTTQHIPHNHSGNRLFDIARLAARDPFPSSSPSSLPINGGSETPSPSVTPAMSLGAMSAAGSDDDGDLKSGGYIEALQAAELEGKTVLTWSQAEKHLVNARARAQRLNTSLDVDFKKAVDHMTRADSPEQFTAGVRMFVAVALRGHVEAVHELSGILWHGRQPIGRRNRHESIKWFRRGVQLGDVRAFYHLGVTYMNGFSTDVDFQESARLFYYAGVCGDEDALFNLGYMHELGKGVKKDLAKAEWFYSSAADKGSQVAQLNLIALRKVMAKAANVSSQEPPSASNSLDAHNDSQNDSKINPAETKQQDEKSAQNNKHMQYSADSQGPPLVMAENYTMSTIMSSMFDQQERKGDRHISFLGAKRPQMERENGAKVTIRLAKDLCCNGKNILAVISLLFLLPFTVFNTIASNDRFAAMYQAEHGNGAALKHSLPLSKRALSFCCTYPLFFFLVFLAPILLPTMIAPHLQAHFSDWTSFTLIGSYVIAAAVLPWTVNVFVRRRQPSIRDVPFSPLQRVHMRLVDMLHCEHTQNPDTFGTTPLPEFFKEQLLSSLSSTSLLDNLHALSPEPEVKDVESKGRSKRKAEVDAPHLSSLSDSGNQLHDPSDLIGQSSEQYLSKLRLDWDHILKEQAGARSFSRRVGLPWTTDNVLAVLALVLEFFQLNALCSMAIHQLGDVRGDIRFIPDILLPLLFWWRGVASFVVWAAAVVIGLLMVFSVIVEFVYFLKKEVYFYDGSDNPVWNLSQYPLLHRFGTITRALSISLISGLLSFSMCVPAVNEYGQHIQVMQRDTSIVCWEGSHRWLSALTLLICVLVSCVLVGGPRAFDVFVDAFLDLWVPERHLFPYRVNAYHCRLIDSCRCLLFTLAEFWTLLVVSFAEFPSSPSLTLRWSPLYVKLSHLLSLIIVVATFIPVSSHPAILARACIIASCLCFMLVYLYRWRPCTLRIALYIRYFSICSALGLLAVCTTVLLMPSHHITPSAHMSVSLPIIIVLITDLGLALFLVLLWRHTQHTSNKHAMHLLSALDSDFFEGIPNLHPNRYIAPEVSFVDVLGSGAAIPLRPNSDLRLSPAMLLNLGCLYSALNHTIEPQGQHGGLDFSAPIPSATLCDRPHNKNVSRITDELVLDRCMIRYAPNGTVHAYVFGANFQPSMIREVLEHKNIDTRLLWSIMCLQVVSLPRTGLKLFVHKTEKEGIFTPSNGFDAMSGVHETRSLYAVHRTAQGHMTASDIRLEKLNTSLI